MRRRDIECMILSQIVPVHMATTGMHAERQGVYEGLERFYAGSEFGRLALAV